LARAGTSPVLLNTALAQAAWVEAWHGNALRALDLASEALSLAAALGQADQTALESLAQGAAHERLGNAEQAGLEYETAIAQLHQAGMASSERYALELDRLRGDASAASERLRELLRRDHVHAARLARRYFPDLEPATAATGLELCVLGPFRAVRDGQAVRVQTATGKLLLLLLLEARIAGQSEVSDLMLADALCPDQPEHAARVIIKNLVYRLRSSLGANAILRTAGGYALGAVTTDAERFLAHPDLSLWRGAYATDTELPESGVQGMLFEKLLEVVRNTLERDARAAVKPARILVDSEPYDTDALTVLLTALRQTENRRDLARVYAAARARLLEVGEHLPESWQVFLQQQT
jgi:hypothetical protein